MKKFFCCLKIDVKSGEEAFRGSESFVQQLPPSLYCASQSF